MEEEKNVQNIPFSDEDIKTLEGLGMNPGYHANLNRKILGFFKHHGLEHTRMQFSYYEDEPGSMVYHRPHKITKMNRVDEPAGGILEFNVLGDWAIAPPDWVWDLQSRLRWDEWPAEFKIHDDYNEPVEFDKKVKTGNCWHHTGIIYNKGFNWKEPFMIVKIEFGYCMCS